MSPKQHPIEAESFRIILSELGPHDFDDRQLQVVLRVIHATADFEFKRTLRFSPHAVDAGVAALRRGCNVIADVKMVKAGISQGFVHKLGGDLFAAINSDPKIAQMAKQHGTTRSTMGMRMNKARLQGAVVAIGNAPTALLELIRLVREENVRPGLIVGVPVGFVSAVESKDALTALDAPYITALGRKGGSPVAVAIVNALLRLALS
ncbi:MAG TPA: precorrin-8X methylmutase [Anaerolineae bacterium]|nr:precorrin-8X methylmutase [Caldilineae bacterium]HID33655.1 precorrin-8X methylmutase [Anaerolineae bacterium]